MPAQFKTLRSTVAGNRPLPATRETGEVYINYPDMQFGVIDTAKNPVDLLATRFFSGATTYNVGDFVVSGGQLYRCIIAVGAPGAFNPANWAKVGTTQDLSAYLPLAGGTMSGQLILAADPSVNFAAATKQYVDNGLSVKLSLSGGTLTGPLILAADPSAGLGAATKQYVDAGDAATNANANAKVPLAGGTMSGLLVLSGDPATPLGAATKQYADTKLPLAGGTLTGPLTLSGAPTLPLHAATKAYVDSGAFVPIGGGTMTGILTLSGAPVNGLDAATKTYADSKLALTGGTLSGALNVGSGAPTLAAGSLYFGSGYLVCGRTVTAFECNQYNDGTNYRAILAGGSGLLQYNGSSGAAVWNFYSNANIAAGAAFTPQNVLTIDQTGCLTFNQFQMAGNRFNFNYAGSALQVGINGSYFANAMLSRSVGSPYTVVLDTMAAANTGTGMAAWSGGAGYTWTVSASDVRLKSSIVEATKDALAAIKSLKLFEFDLTMPGATESRHWNWGLMADDALELAIPASYEPARETEQGTLYAMAHDLPLIAALVKAVQQLSAKVEALEAQLA